MQALKTIKGFILAAALLVSLILLVGLYFTTSHAYSSAVRDNAISSSESLARNTFNAMYQIMRQGWSRAQLEEFIASLEQTSSKTSHTTTIYRGELVNHLFGSIGSQPGDTMINETFSSGQAVSIVSDTSIRYSYPLTAKDECLQCHTNAKTGNILGVIEVRQDLTPLLSKAESQLLAPLALIAPIPFIMALLVAFMLNKRINRSLAILDTNIDQVNRVSDLKNIDLNEVDLGFTELNNIFHKVAMLGTKLKSVAVDKELLEFEIRLLEKFVITSDVVRDWREYVSTMLGEINRVIDAYTLFSIFKVDDELFDLEIFWISPPSERTRDSMERAVKKALENHPSFSSFPSLVINHNISDPAGEIIELDNDQIELQTKSLFVDTPKIGGIVGIGVQSGLGDDEVRILVMESILSTLLNVVGSVKAIYKYTKDLEYYATRDPLTDLYNQRIFWELLGYEINRAERHDYAFSLLVIDLDNFKSVNDSYGHSFGDRFLQEFASAIDDAMRNGDVLARYGGDEFVVLLPESDQEHALPVCERILQNANRLTLEAPDGSAAKATVSIGLATYPAHATEGKDLFMFADNMMYKAKTEGKNRIGVPTDQDVVEVFKKIGEKSQIINDAIQQKRIIPFFQPIYNVQEDRVDAFEVLSRIQLEDETIMGAFEFIEIAERMGVIHMLDIIVIEKAFAKLQESGYGGKLFINLSPRALVLSDFIPEIRRLTEKYNIEHDRIVFEITERDTVKNMSLLEKFVNELKSDGYQLAIDDFGSGFSSFHYLKRFPIDFVKIEGDFVANMLNDPRDLALVHSISALAGDLNLYSIAEFVEDAEVLDEVRKAGITYAQGYHIGKPSPEMVTTIGTIAHS
ncbi:hypothetical protein BOW53_11240 [Solemya pervernicosa gill symbiont]|uniref:GGDEF-domain containing protein n=2 Tax=Gammaproteobacteria incertae sedis TaxID=118884 RepID=A0A1T2L322_9GAMM|nr:bifunctional diguanylate cyclase/phosphodiesterase [Candidatus Reidiella endopervernicosa]OOZ39479.1 hypothetical protein BOW53_11240 [Solemya pervernicosa gill symbiont]QKQ25896.1 bifunctional diguanylate cyclase/phosphodiesterase [Candidatus Reidiella endopervernicosa]